MTTQITATFTFDRWDEQEVLSTDAARIVRTTFVKTFVGDLEGTSRGEMVMAYAGQDSAAYTGYERVEGLMAGRSGSFILRHNAFMAADGVESEVVVMASSGTDGMAGISGTASIDRSEDGGHSFTLGYVIVEAEPSDPA
ncbi:MAG: DUF3224 domain-containing protein [Actinomycetota bacterium]|nr:DUF3224 domain-containing protein [Actinomycetota bacterium]